VLFDENGRLKRFDSEKEILEQFFGLRSELYAKRKNHSLAKLLKELRVLENKVRFITAIISKDLDVMGVPKSEISQELARRGFATSSELAAVLQGSDSPMKDEEVAAKEYDYLMSMPIWTLTKERVDELSA